MAFENSKFQKNRSNWKIHAEDPTLKSNNCFNVRSESLYGSWQSHDHQSIVWDNGLVRATARAIYDVTLNRIQSSPNEKLKTTNEILKYHFVNRFHKINKYDEAVILRSKQFQNQLLERPLDLERLYNDKILVISGNGLYKFNLSTLKDILEKNQTDDPKIENLDGFYIVSKLAHSVKISDRFVDSILIKNGYTYTRIKIQNWTDEIFIATDGDFTIKLEIENRQNLQVGCPLAKKCCNSLIAVLLF